MTPYLLALSKPEIKDESATLVQDRRAGAHGQAWTNVPFSAEPDQVPAPLQH
jgi:hypothetical protein